MALSDQQRKAARLLANRRTYAQAAKAVGVCHRTIDNWKTLPEFREQVAAFSEAWRGEIRGMMDSDQRLRHLIGRHHRLHDIILDRAKDPAMQTVPGGRTGMLVTTYKMLNRVDEEGNRISEPVPEHAVDTALAAEMRAIEDKIAALRGETKPQRIEATLTVDPIVVTLADCLTREELLALMSKLTPEEPKEPSADPGSEATTFLRQAE